MKISLKLQKTRHIFWSINCKKHKSFASFLTYYVVPHLKPNPKLTFAYTSKTKSLQVFSCEVWEADVRI